MKPTSAALLLQLFFPDDLLYMATFVQLAVGFLQLSPQSLEKSSGSVEGAGNGGDKAGRLEMFPAW